MNFDTRTIDDLASALIDELKIVYASSEPMGTGLPALPNIATQGRGAEALAILWSEITRGSSHLGSRFMMGHMDTAPHPVAAMTDALVSALNNNLLFRELSPLASQIEEQLVEFLGEKLGLQTGTPGTFVSGGSLTNLTALFAACGGYPKAGESRADIRLIVPSNAHVSIRKAAGVLGIGSDQIVVPESDYQGRLLPDALEAALKAIPNYRKIVMINLGSTIHGAVDPLAQLVPIAKAHNAWIHVDAIYGAGLAFSDKHRHLLQGLELADSVAAGPQKWMYVPRVSSVVFIRDKVLFDEALGMSIPYSVTGEEHRGQWGIQGSRRADALTLWMTLQAMGTEGLGDLVNDRIALTRHFHALLTASDFFEPLHEPDLNLLCFRPVGDVSDEQMQAAHQRLTDAGGPWVSLSSWAGQLVFRAVLLAPGTGEDELRSLLRDLERLFRK